MKTELDTIMWAIYRNLELKYGKAIASSNFSPLSYYVYSNRASVQFEKNLLKSDIYKIAAILHRGGSDAEAIRRIKKHLRIPEE